jgi:hypothetical protein
LPISLFDSAKAVSASSWPPGELTDLAGRQTAVYERDGLPLAIQVVDSKGARSVVA